MPEHKQNIPDRATKSVELSRIASKALPEKTTDRVIIEQAVTIMIDKVGSFTIMCTPVDIEALAVGFVFSEGIINGMEDVVAVCVKEELPNVVGITVQDPARIATKRNLIVTSSCGMCGVRNIRKMLSEIPACDHSMTISGDAIAGITENLRSMQKIFQVTGGSHAAGIFKSSGEIISFAEDLGRHSALDKAIGKCLIAGQSMKGTGVVLSGRVSLEMVTKAARAGIELIIAVSAPSSFAVEAAEKWNITLCGFVRDNRVNIYTHRERIKDLKKNDK